MWVGGGNGGGKSHLLRVGPLRPQYLGRAGCRCALFAETNPKLEMADGLVDKCREMYPGVGGDYVATPKKRWRFPTGATIDLSYVGDPDQWDGSQIPFIGIDQAEQLTAEQLWSLHSRNRTSSGAPCQLMATANPPAEGKEHWLTRMLTAGGWIGADGYPVPEMDGKVRHFLRKGDDFIFADTAEELLPLCKLGSDGQPVPPQTMTFVQMLVGDHPVESFRREYEQKLSGLTEIEQLRRWDGNWHATEEAGKYFKKEFFWPPIEYERPESGVRKVRSWDCAWSQSDGADWTPGIRMEQGVDNYVTVTDLLRFRGSQAHVERAIKAVAQLDGKDVEIRLPKDAGLAGFAQSALARWLAAHGYQVTLTADKGDKITRSNPYQARCERKEVRLARSHDSAGVAELLTQPFEVHDAEGKKVTIKGLDISNVSTLHDWHTSFLLDHVRFGRNTIKNRKIKKDVVDAAVGGNDVLTNDPADPADVDEEQLRRTVAAARASLGGTPQRSPGFGGSRGSRWL